MKTSHNIILCISFLLCNTPDLISKHFVLISAPGSGKGTFSQYMAKKYDYVHIGLGDIFRNRIDRHRSTASNVLNKIMQKYIEKALKKNKYFILDNAISSIQSWELWNNFFQEHNIQKDVCCVVLEASDKTCIDRIKDRLICKKCCNVSKKKKKVSVQEQRCKECNSILSIRDEDHDPLFLMKRFKRYHDEIDPILNIIEKSYSVIKISSEDSLDHLYKIYDQLHKL